MMGSVESICQRSALPPWPPGPTRWRLRSSCSISLHTGHGTVPAEHARRAQLWLPGCTANHCSRQSPQNRCEQEVSFGLQPTRLTKQILQINSSHMSFFSIASRMSCSTSTLTSPGFALTSASSAASCGASALVSATSAALLVAIWSAAFFGATFGRSRASRVLNLRSSCSMCARAAPSRPLALASSWADHLRISARWSCSLLLSASSSVRHRSWSSWFTVASARWRQPVNSWMSPSILFRMLLTSCCICQALADISALQAFLLRRRTG
mmetsp:Transcript_47417/g.141557  ORF Transcript_47417/g.141557 Transcript_47417/m.141557 type:complete len:269 (+) Transcript_47417:1099-1905(+)